MKEYDFDPRNLPQDALAAMGLAMASAAQTETTVQWAITGCLGLDTEYGGAVTTHMQMPLRFSILRSVAEIRIDNLDALDDLDRLIEQVEKAFEKRNALAHHQWGRDPETGELFTLKEISRASYQIDLIPMSVDQIKSDALFIYEAGMELMKFLMALKLLPPPPPIRPRAHKSKAARKKRREAALKK